MEERIRSFRDLRVYQQAFAAAMEIYEITKRFPADERYSMVDQIRRSSRSVCANLAECWRRRRYRAAFIAKLNDCESEAAESQVWLDFSLKCGYIDANTWTRLDDAYDHIQRQLVNMATRPHQWLIGSGPSTAADS